MTNLEKKTKFSRSNFLKNQDGGMGCFQLQKEEVSVCSLLKNMGIFLNEKVVRCTQKRKFKHALFFSKYAVELFPSHAVILTNRANALYNVKDYLGCIQYTTKALEMDDTYIRAWSLRGYARHALNLFDDCQRDYERAVNLAEEQQKMHTMTRTLKFLIILMSRPELAREQRKNMFPWMDKLPRTLINLKFMMKKCYVSNFWGQTIWCCDQIINLRKDFIAAHFFKAKALAYSSQWNLSIISYGHCIQYLYYNMKNLTSAMRNQRSQMAERFFMTWEGYAFVKLRSLIEKKPKNKKQLFNELMHCEKMIHEALKMKPLEPSSLIIRAEIRSHIHKLTACPRIKKSILDDTTEIMRKVPKETKTFQKALDIEKTLL